MAAPSSIPDFVTVAHDKIYELARNFTDESDNFYNWEEHPVLEAYVTLKESVGLPGFEPIVKFRNEDISRGANGSLVFNKDASEYVSRVGVHDFTLISFRPPPHGRKTLIQSSWKILADKSPQN